jgi:hypothetical protein
MLKRSVNFIETDILNAFNSPCGLDETVNADNEEKRI